MLSFTSATQPSLTNHFQKVPLEVPPDSVLVRMLAAPINPSDLNQVEGVYPIKPDLPAGNASWHVYTLLSILFYSTLK